jgi:hypothetical protein
MNASHLTNFRQNEKKRSPKGKRGDPHCVVRHHSITVPIYAHPICGKTRYTIAFYQDGRRRRRCFSDLTKAKKEAKIIGNDRRDQVC